MFFSGLPASWKQIRKDAGSRPLVLSFKAKPVGVLARRPRQVLPPLVRRRSA